MANNATDDGPVTPKRPAEQPLSRLHPYAGVLNAALVYVVYLVSLGGGFLLQFNPPLSEGWTYGVLLFGGLVITLLLQMKFARRIWSLWRQDRYLTLAAIALGIAFAGYIWLSNAYVMDYKGRPLVIGSTLLPEWKTRCEGIGISETTKCIEAFGDQLEGGARADVFFGRSEISTIVTSLHLSYTAMAFILIFTITGLLEMLRPPTGSPRKGV